MIVRDVLASTYTLLDNATEEELEPAVALEFFASLISMMKYEQVFGNLDDIITKDSVTFSDTTGIVTNNLTDFGDVVYLSLNNNALNECPVSMLDLYRDSSLQRVAFWTDATTSTKYIQLAIPETGTLDIWYEPFTTVDRYGDATLDLHESLRWCIAGRLAEMCLPYVKYKNIYKIQNKPQLAQTLAKQAFDWKQIYLEKVNRIGTNRPFTRLPFRAY